MTLPAPGERQVGLRAALGAMAQELAYLEATPGDVISMGAAARTFRPIYAALAAQIPAQEERGRRADDMNWTAAELAVLAILTRRVAAALNREVLARLSVPAQEERLREAVEKRLAPAYRDYAGHVEGAGSVQPRVVQRLVEAAFDVLRALGVEPQDDGEPKDG